MRLLLDTHTFLWWISDDPQLSAAARQLIGYTDDILYLSAASGWEVAIKVRLGKLKLPREIKGYIPAQIAVKGIQLLPIEMSHALHVSTLPDYHRDPFDRILVAQSQLDQLPIMTIDPLIAQYPVATLW